MTKNGNQKIEMKFDLERMENIMGKGENLSIFSFPHNVFKGNNITYSSKFIT